MTSTDLIQYTMQYEKYKNGKNKEKKKTHTKMCINMFCSSLPCAIDGKFKRERNQTELNRTKLNGEIEENEKKKKIRKYVYNNKNKKRKNEEK